MAVLTGFVKLKQVVRFVVNWGPGNHDALPALVRSASSLFWGSWILARLYEIARVLGEGVVINTRSADRSK
jgi:hypothetical protein